MSIDLSIKGWRNIKEARLLDENPLSIIVGFNESGKSNLVGAIKFALTGTAFGRKTGATVDGLVTHGEEKMSVQLNIQNFSATRTKTGGDTLKSIADRLGTTTDLLPLMFDAKMCGDGGNKAMRTFLDSAASTAFNPLAHFVTDPITYEAVLKARSCGKLTTKSIIEYCEGMRALQKDPPAPVMPAFARPTLEEIAAARQNLANAQELEAGSQRDYTDRALLGQRLAQLFQARNQLVIYEKQRQAASMVDPLKERRQALNKVLNINLESMRAVDSILLSAGYDSSSVRLAIEFVAHAKAEVQGVLNSNPVPASMPTPPTISDEVFAMCTEFGAPSTSAVEAVMHFSDADIRDLLAESGKQTNESRAVSDLNKANVARCQNIHDELTKKVGAMDAYDRALPAWEENKMFVGVEWQRWDNAAKTIAAAETKHVNESGDVFSQLVSDYSSTILQGRKIRISRDEGIFLGPENISDCSESTQWRMEASILAAVGVILKSPILLLDGADILDPVNKILMENYLIQNIVPHFKHTVLTHTTTKDSLDQEVATPAGCGATRWVIDRGMLRRLS